MNLSKIAAELIRTIEQCRGLGVPLDRLDSCRELAEANEPGVALEILCSNLHEYDVVVPAEIYATLANLGSNMGIDAAVTTRSTTTAHAGALSKSRDDERANDGDEHDSTSLWN